MKEMTVAQQKAKTLLYEPAYASDKDAAVKQAAAAFSEGYKDFLTRCKTEREVAAYAEEALKAAGSTDPGAVKAALPGVTYTGVSGDIAFDEIGDAIRDTAYIKVLTLPTTPGRWRLSRP